MRKRKLLKNNLKLEEIRRKVAREAALLIYTLQEKEFKQAKVKAAENLGTRILPSNLEVAIELDRLADEFEGEERKRRLISIRKEALKVMMKLERFNPRLIGSVWRGTANKNSDIDIMVYASNPDAVIKHIREAGFKIERIEKIPAQIDGEREEITHIHLSLTSGREAEIVIRGTEKINMEVTCEIYGDPIKGLSILELQNLLREDPLRRYLPDRIRA